MKIPFTRANIGMEEIKAVTKVLKSGWLTMGDETLMLENEFAEYVDAKQAISVNSCTAALFLALKALGIKSGDEIIVPSFTFPSTISVIIHCNAIPVFADINEEDYTIDQKSIESLITKKTKAIIPVHYAGNRADVQSDLPVIEDSAHLIPKNGDNKKTFARCYSFYATKNMTTGEGGMITLQDNEKAEWLRKARLHGLSKDAWKRYELKSKWVYEVEFPGYKYNLTDVAAALGRVQLKRLDEFENRRREIVAYYNKIFGLSNKGTHLYPILVENRNEFFKYMQEKGIGCSFHFLPLHLEPAFKKYRRSSLPVTEKVASQVVTLPLDAMLSDAEIEEVVKAVKNFRG